MSVTIYRLVCGFLAPLFLVTSLLFGFMAVYRGEVILGLQSELLKVKDRDIKVVIEKIEAVNQVGTDYSDTQSSILKDQKETIREYTKIIEVPTFTNVCISDDGVLKYNETIGKYKAQINPASEPSTGVH